MRGKLQGYRTYVLAVVAIVAAVAGYLTGDLTLQAALDQAWLGGVAASLRAGVASLA